MKGHTTFHVRNATRDVRPGDSFFSVSSCVALVVGRLANTRAPRSVDNPRGPPPGPSRLRARTEGRIPPPRMISRSLARKRALKAKIWTRFRFCSGSGSAAEPMFEIPARASGSRTPRHQCTQSGAESACALARRTVFDKWHTMLPLHRCIVFCLGASSCHPSAHISTLICGVCLGCPKAAALSGACKMPALSTRAHTHTHIRNRRPFQADAFGEEARVANTLRSRHTVERESGLIQC